DVAVEKKQRRAADRRAPHAQEHLALLERADDAQLVARLVERDADRRVRGLDRRVLGDLLAVAVDALVEIALAIHEPDRNERQPDVARRLAMVAGEHAQAAG